MRAANDNNEEKPCFQGYGKGLSLVYHTGDFHTLFILERFSTFEGETEGIPSSLEQGEILGLMERLRCSHPQASRHAPTATVSTWFVP